MVATAMRKATRGVLAVSLVGTLCVPFAVPRVAFAANATGAAAIQSSAATFGSAGTVLAPGTYDVPVSLRKAADTSQASGAAAVVPFAATLTVSDSGTATLQTKLNPVSMAGLTDYAYDVRVYWGTGKSYRSSKAVAAREDSTITTPASTFGGSKTVPDSISFEIPDNAADGVYLCFHVDAMNSDTDAYLAIDYAHAVASGETMTFTGSSHVDQFGQYDVNTTVSVKDGKIVGVDAQGANFQGSYVGQNQSYLKKALRGVKKTGLWDGMTPSTSNADSIYNAVYQNATTREAVDAVSGATYSAEAIRNGVMNAFGLTHEETAQVPESIAAGTYTVPVSVQSEYVRHYLSQDKTATATLNVASDGSMKLTAPLRPREDGSLFVLDVMGYYRDNTISSALSTKGLKLERTVPDFSDEYFAADTPVVSGMTVPLAGGLSNRYRIATKLYVPPMNGVTGTFDGISIDHGTFEVASDIVVDWQNLKKVKGADTTKGGCAVTKAGVTYRVSSASAKTATVLRAKAGIKKASIPATVKMGGTTYRVTSVAAKAFKGKKKLTAVTIGKNVSKIGASAFQGCRKLKSITINGSKVRSVGKKAFSGVNAKAKFTVASKSSLAMLKKAGAPKKATYRVK